MPSGCAGSIARWGLQLRNKSPKRRVKAQLREDRSPASAANQVWAMDFVHDQLFDGRRLRALTVVDAYTSGHRSRPRHPRGPANRGLCLCPGSKSGAADRSPRRFLRRAAGRWLRRLQGAGRTRSGAARGVNASASSPSASVASNRGFRCRQRLMQPAFMRNAGDTSHRRTPDAPILGSRAAGYSPHRRAPGCGWQESASRGSPRGFAR
jgi:hypothetical protein